MVVEEKRGGTAGRSGGPVTKRGKARVRLNPIKHGVLSQTPVIPLVERQEDWDRLRAGLYDAWTPEGAMQEAMVERIAGIVWRMRRNMRFECASIEGYMRDVPRDWREARQDMGLPVPRTLTAEAVAEMDRMLMARLLPGDEALDKVMRYETKLHRFLLQTTHQLLVLKGLMPNRVKFPTGIADLNAPGMPGTRKQPLLMARNDRVPRRSKEPLTGQAGASSKRAGSGEEANEGEESQTGE